MNTKKFCEQFERIFGPFQLDRLRNKELVVSGGREFVSSPYSNFVYEVSLYLNAPISDVKVAYDDECRQLFKLCYNVYRAFRRNFRKKCKKGRLATYITGSNLHKCFTRYRYVD